MPHLPASPCCRHYPAPRPPCLTPYLLLQWLLDRKLAPAHYGAGALGTQVTQAQAHTTPSHPP